MYAAKNIQGIPSTRGLFSSLYQSIQNAAESGADLTDCCLTHIRLGQTKFTEMGFQEQEMVGKFFQSLKENPTLIAVCQVYGEKMTQESAQGFHNLLETVVLREGNYLVGKWLCKRSIM